MSDVLTCHYQNSSVELVAVETKKLALQSLVKVTKTIKRLLSSMDAVTRLSNTSFQLPPAMKKFHQCLYVKFSHDPTNIVEANLTEIERRIRTDMASIIKLTELSENEFMQYVDQTDRESNGHKVLNIVRIFRRRAKTAISLRLILKERGISHKPLVLDVDESEILASITSLEKKEQHCVNQVKENIEDFVKSIDIIFIDGNTDKLVLDYLTSIRKGLIQNLEHLNAGKSIIEIPFPFEQVEVEKDEQALSVDREVTYEPTHEHSLMPESGTAVRQEGSKPPLKKSFVMKLWIWLTSPMDVSWSKKGRHK
ncbi:hypothetical protein MNBD_GAMMA12-1555 [hydrothermal vent metagenome]|uniref:Uncharacterized protein n=1 Tax=hydrothermal vent metagenome TaxID=652676 RepID=A0A3B0Y7X7_9ZZZZ